ncbi:MAG: 50S ribosomal protein L20 [Candidatus Paraimprobicoccus trichonymphae]|uniref:Large ribosomal subunit protein bL20 n=1 Tax=Candidatus Paraimprobicoccus trichonymphae TaxID=3033793 RepID=A0AA48IHN1_9FIRM|nr:MAG: 50S ribosomal protein L20 [Candidatus Paraimprobicoccus trichonymphae]
MGRVSNSVATRARRKKVLKSAKGYWGAKSKKFKMAKQAVMKSGNYAYIGRKHRKRDFRRLWITRISAACRLNGLNYSNFMCKLKNHNVLLNRKSLSEMAIADINSFSGLIKSLTE